MQKTNGAVISIAAASELVTLTRKARDQTMDRGGDWSENLNEKCDRLLSNSVEEEEDTFRSLPV